MGKKAFVYPGLIKKISDWFFGALKIKYFE